MTDIESSTNLIEAEVLGSRVLGKVATRRAEGWSGILAEVAGWRDLTQSWWSDARRSRRRPVRWAAGTCTSATWWRVSGSGGVAALNAPRLAASHPSGPDATHFQRARRKFSLLVIIKIYVHNTRFKLTPIEIRNEATPKQLTPSSANTNGVILATYCKAMLVFI